MENAKKLASAKDCRKNELYIMNSTLRADWFRKSPNRTIRSKTA